MNYRTRRDRTAEEVAQLWQDAKEARERVVALIAERDKRATQACTEHAQLLWTNAELYHPLAQIFTPQGASLMTQAQAGPSGANALRAFVESYTSLPSAIQAERFPAISVPLVPEPPADGEHDELERWEAEVDGFRLTLSRLEERLRDDDRKLEELGAATRASRQRLREQGEIHRAKRCAHWIRRLEKALAESPFGRGAEPPTPTRTEPVSMRTPTLWLAFALVALAQVGLLVAVDEMPLLRGGAWLVGLFALTAGALSWRRRRHLPAPRGNDKRTGLGARWGIGPFVMIHLFATAGAAVVLLARGYALSTWVVVLGLLTASSALVAGAWLVWREWASTSILRRLMRSDAPVFEGTVNEGGRRRTRSFHRETTYLPPDDQGRQQTASHWAWFEDGSGSSWASVALDDGREVAVDLTNARWASTRVRERSGAFEETFGPGDRVLLRGRVHEGDVVDLETDDGTVIVVATENAPPRAELRARRRRHWASVAGFIAIAAVGGVVSWWNPSRTDRLYAGVVVAREMPGIEPGARCIADLRHVGHEGGRGPCQLAVTCNDRLLYGGVGLGVIFCTFDADGDPARRRVKRTTKGR